MITDIQFHVYFSSLLFYGVYFVMLIILSVSYIHIAFQERHVICYFIS